MAPVAPVAPVAPLDPLGELPLENDPSNFVRRRGGLEPYLSKPSCPPLKFDTLKSRGFVWTKRHFSKKHVVSSRRNAHFSNGMSSVAVKFHIGQKGL